MDALADSGEKGLLQLVMASHAGMTTKEFEQIVGNWLMTARHPRFNRPYHAGGASYRRGWTAVDMKRDWKLIYPFEPPDSE